MCLTAAALCLLEAATKATAHLAMCRAEQADAAARLGIVVQGELLILLTSGTTAAEEEAMRAAAVDAECNASRAGGGIPLASGALGEDSRRKCAHRIP